MPPQPRSTRAGIEVALRAIRTPGDPTGHHLRLAVEIEPVSVDLLAPAQANTVGGVEVVPFPINLVPTGQRGSLAVLSGLEVALRAVGAPGDPAGFHAVLAIEVVPLPINLLAPFHRVTVGAIIVGVAVHPSPSVRRAREHNLLRRRGKRGEREIHVAVLSILAIHGTDRSKLPDIGVGHATGRRSPRIACHPSRPSVAFHHIRAEYIGRQYIVEPVLVRVDANFVSRGANRIAVRGSYFAEHVRSHLLLGSVLHIKVDRKRKVRWRDACGL